MHNERSTSSRKKKINTSGKRCMYLFFYFQIYIYIYYITLKQNICERNAEEICGKSKPPCSTQPLCLSFKAGLVCRQLLLAAPGTTCGLPPPSPPPPPTGKKRCSPAPSHPSRVSARHAFLLHHVPRLLPEQGFLEGYRKELGRELCGASCAILLPER